MFGDGLRASLSFYIEEMLWEGAPSTDCLSGFGFALIVQTVIRFSSLLCADRKRIKQGPPSPLREGL